MSTRISEPIVIPKYFRDQILLEDLYVHPSLTNIILDLDKGTILTRTPLRWLELLIFYLVFYICIAILWWASFKVFESHISYKRPKWYLVQPGFGFQPATIGKNHLLIYYNERSEEEVQNIVELVNESVSKYGNVPNQYFQDCHEYNNYGYKERKPCFFLKINRIFGFKTQPIETLSDLPHDAPSELRQYLESKSQVDLKQRIWVSCESKPKLKFHYFPQRFYKTSAIEDFDSPKLRNETTFERVIAIQPEGIFENVKYYIYCYLWAKNIARELEGDMGKGLVKFKLRIQSS